MPSHGRCINRPCSLRHANQAAATGPKDPSSAARHRHQTFSVGQQLQQINSSYQVSSGSGSEVRADGNVNITASQGDLHVRGSSITAGKDLSLDAQKGNLILEAAENRYTEQNSHSSNSAGVGVGISVGPKPASRSTHRPAKARGNGQGAGTSYTNTNVKAGGTATLHSGRAPPCAGATVGGQYRQGRHRRQPASSKAFARHQTLQPKPAAAAAWRHRAKGGAIPLLGQQDKDALGADYAQQYAVIENFHQALNNSVSAPARKMLQTGSFNSLGDIIKRRGELKLLRGSLQQLRTALDENLTKADAAHAAMQQPDDLKTVYDKAYHKAVTSPANGYKDIFPAMERLFDSIDQVADYVDSHQAQVQVTGSMVQVQDPKILAELNALIEQIERNSKALNDIQAQFIKAIEGGLILAADLALT
ncbi:hypothetical protein FQA39_LY18747 [Lamprigera yunnana]|nr:hypothetical protein FQA39_LY18747 [Lamprigera yunnana]